MILLIICFRKNSKKTRDMWWYGIPPSVRGKVWQLAFGNDLNITQGKSLCQVSRKSIGCGVWVHLKYFSFFPILLQRKKENFYDFLYDSQSHKIFLKWKSTHKERHFLPEVERKAKRKQL